MMKTSTKLLFLGSLLSFSQAPSALAETPPAHPVKAEANPSAEERPLACDAKQVTILREADHRAAPYNLHKHLSKNFPDRKVSWLMKDSTYQTYVVKTQAKNFGRCNAAGCFLFVAPAAVIHEAVKKSMKDGKHDPAVIGKALGLPAANFEGPLRMMTLDLNTAGSCARLPIDDDPGVWKCQTPQDTDCFKFGGYTSGGVPELMVINAPVEKTAVEVVP
jgi:hypothetical protein